jgi:hypothetical protein
MLPRLSVIWYEPETGETEVAAPSVPNAIAQAIGIAKGTTRGTVVAVELDGVAIYVAIAMGNGGSHTLLATAGDRSTESHEHRASLAAHACEHAKRVVQSTSASDPAYDSIVRRLREATTAAYAADGLVDARRAHLARTGAL